MELRWEEGGSMVLERVDRSFAGSRLPYGGAMGVVRDCSG